MCLSSPLVKFQSESECLSKVISTYRQTQPPKQVWNSTFVECTSSLKIRQWNCWNLKTCFWPRFAIFEIFKFLFSVRVWLSKIQYCWDNFLVSCCCWVATCIIWLRLLSNCWANATCWDLEQFWKSKDWWDFISRSWTKKYLQSLQSSYSANTHSFKIPKGL